MISARTLAPALALLLSGCLDTRIETYCQREPYSALCTLEATGLAPVEGPIAGGTTVTIQGHGFDQDSEVQVDGVPATIVSRTNGSLVVRTPPHAEGNAVFSVVNSLGAVEVPTAFRYAAPPILSEVSPNEADRTGGARITISGANLTGATVTIGGRALLDVSATATEITGHPPQPDARAAGRRRHHRGRLGDASRELPRPRLVPEQRRLAGSDRPRVLGRRGLGRAALPRGERR